MFRDEILQGINAKRDLVLKNKRINTPYNNSVKLMDQNFINLYNARPVHHICIKLNSVVKVYKKTWFTSFI
jgi:hypothetical protein